METAKAVTTNSLLVEISRIEEEPVAMARGISRRVLSCFALLALPSFCLGADRAVASEARGDLERSFLAPPDEARPWVLWYWYGGQISREGITADLESMARNGIGGAVLGDIHGASEGPTRFMSPEWQELFAHALSEAQRLGLKISTCPCAGWCASGGPWITPEQSMQVLVWSETRVQGPRPFDGRLPQPQTVLDHYRDVAVLALPSQDRTLDELEKVSSNPERQDIGAVLGGDPATSVVFRSEAGAGPPYIEFVYRKPVRIQGLTLEFASEVKEASVRLEASDDGRTYRVVKEFQYKIPYIRAAVNRLSETFKPAEARRFRVVLGEPPGTSELGVSELRLHGDERIEDWLGKSLYEMNQVISPETGLGLPPAQGIARSGIVDLTSKMTGDGRLDWQVPEGEWTILRFGHTSNGSVNRPAAPGAGEGLESDKFRRDVTEYHFDNYMGKLARRYPSFMGSTLVATWVDSWESGIQNWSPVFADEFRRRRGYDPIPWLPAMTGRVVESGELSERFLWDVRRTIADLTAENFLGALRSLGAPHGIGLWFQPFNRHSMDALQGVGQSTGGESNMWYNTRDQLKPQFDREKLCASAAHVYGQRVVHTEAATAAAPAGIFNDTPATLRELANASFCAGVNNLWMHVFLHQPWSKAQPGQGWKWGLHFQRNNTWFEKIDAWSAYVARCQYMLRQGRFVADVCVFMGETVPSGPATLRSLMKEMDRELPSGFDYDVCNAEAIVERMSVKDGRIVLPDGMSYAMLVAPSDVRAMRPEVVKKIGELVKQGATLVGPRPLASPSLSGYPGCDDEIKRLADEIWGPCDGEQTTEHVYGKGRVYWGKPLGRVLSEIGLKPDFTFASAFEDAAIECHHRRVDGMDGMDNVDGADIYFVANRLPRAEEALCSFRVADKAPELWRPDTGQMETMGVCRQSEGLIAAPIRLEPYGAVFVVFQRPAGADPVCTVFRDDQPVVDATAPPKRPPAGAAILEVSRAGAADGLVVRAFENGSYRLRTASGKTASVQVTGLPSPTTIDGPWTLTFPPDWGAPASATLEDLLPWNEHPDDGVKYFSGTATYAKDLRIPAELLSANRRLWLDLGEVKEVAEVKLNGKSLGILWKQPFQIEITGAARQGINRLEIEVTNQWINRMIGDERQFPDDVEWRSIARSRAGGDLLEMVGLPEWFADWTSGKRPRPSGRFTFETTKFYSANDELAPSGLLGPVRLIAAETLEVPVERLKPSLRTSFRSRELTCNHKAFHAAPSCEEALWERRRWRYRRRSARTPGKAPNRAGRRMSF